MRESLMNEAVRRQSLIDEGIPHSDPRMTLQAQMRDTLHGCMCTQMCFIVPCTANWLTTGVHAFIIRILGTCCFILNKSNACLLNALIILQQPFIFACLATLPPKSSSL